MLAVAHTDHLTETMGMEMIELIFICGRGSAAYCAYMFFHPLYQGEKKKPKILMNPRVL